MPKRVFLIILDGVGCGEMPDAAAFGDAGSNTLGNVASSFPDGLNMPNMASLGLGNIVPLRGVPRASRPKGAFGKAAEAGPAKDTTLGHWEIAGVIATQAFPTFPDGFPPEVLDPFIKRCGIPGILCNKPASGTVVLDELGEEHLATRKPIVYTSGDSVFQIACHEEIYPPEELYRQCKIAREILDGPYRVGRVIARPFAGKPGSFKRTSGRHDYSVEPVGLTVLDVMTEAGLHVDAIGKISDIFAGRGISHSTPTTSNAHGMETILRRADEVHTQALFFANLVDTDMLFGHRNDPAGFKGALQAFDAWLPKFLKKLMPEDLVIVTADHGIDPTTISTDHSREYVPILVTGPLVIPGIDLGTRATFADVGKTIETYFGLDRLRSGTSFLGDILAT